MIRRALLTSLKQTQWMALRSRSLSLQRATASHLPRVSFPQHFNSAIKFNVRCLSSDFPSYNTIAMPALSPTMEIGKIAKWVAKEGDFVSPGDILAEIETDKATLGFETQEEGYVAKILVLEGSDEIPVGKPVAILVDSKELVDAFKSFTAEQLDSQSGGKAPSPSSSSSPQSSSSSTSPSPQSSSSSTSPPASSSLATNSTSSDRVFASPFAKKIARDNNIQLSQIKPTGPNNRIIGVDVQNFLSEGGAQQTLAATQTQEIQTTFSQEFQDIPHTNMRKVIAQRLTQSKQSIPHYYLTSEIYIDEVLAVRENLNKELEVKLSLNDFIIKAACCAINKIPAVNSSWMDSFIRQYTHADICVAVATDNGLITPIVKKANTKGLYTISSEVRDLASRARNNKLKPEEYQGGTFTISNLGMYGVKSFSAIVNPPQSCILAIGAADKKLLPSDSDEQYKVVTSLHVTLSCDHRTVDGAVGAQWLSSFKGFLEKPITMLL